MSSKNPPLSTGDGKILWNGYKSVLLISYVQATNGVEEFAANNSRIIRNIRMA